MNNNPFVGPRPIKEGDPLFGRGRETKELRHLLSAERIVLLYSPSGAGKSSLVAAGLLPEMRKRFDVWPALRMGEKPPDESPGWNRYVWSVASSLGLAESQPSSLADCIQRRERERTNILLVFDQFEELLRHDPHGVQTKQNFLDELTELLRDTTIWALFMLREDYLAQLDPYAARLPTRLKNRYRIELLDCEQAAGVMRDLAKSRGVDFAAAPELALNQSAGTGLFVEPLALQVVCQRLWDELPETKTITSADVKKYGNPTTALSDYYSRQVKRLVTETVSEAEIRNWFQYKIISSDGVRRQLAIKNGAVEKLPAAVVDALEAAHLLRKETRSGADWYELAHDRFISAVREDNDRNLTTAQKQAAIWNEQNRPARLLLRGHALHRARKTPDTADFLKASLKAAHRRLLLYTAIAAVMLLILATAAWALDQRQKALTAAATSDSLRLASVALQMQPTAPDLAFLLTVEAAKRSPTYESRSQLNSFSRKAEDAAFTLPPGQVAFRLSEDGNLMATESVDPPKEKITIWDLRTGRARPFAIDAANGHSFAFDHSGERLGLVNEDHVTVFDTATGRLLGKKNLSSFPQSSVMLPGLVVGFVALDYQFVLEPFDGPAKQLPHCGPMLSGIESGLPTCLDHKGLLLYLSQHPEAPPVIYHLPEKVHQVAFTPDAQSAAIVTPEDDGEHLLVLSPAGVLHQIRLGKGETTSVAIASNGSSVAVGDKTGRIRLCNLASEVDFIAEFQAHSSEIKQLEFTPRGSVVSMASDGISIRTDGDPRAVPVGVLSSSIHRMAVSPDGRTVAASDAHNTICRTSFPAGKPECAQWSRSAESLTWNALGDTLVASDGWNELFVWSGQKQISATVDPGHSDQHEIAFLPNGTLLTAKDHLYPRFRSSTAPLQVLTAELPKRWPAQQMERFIAASTSGLIAQACNSGSVCIWDSKHPDQTLQVQVFAGQRISKIAFSRDNSMLAVAGGREGVQTISLGPLRGGESLDMRSSRHLQAVGGGYGSDLSFSADGSILASTREDLRLWDVRTKKLLGEPWQARPYTSLRALFLTGQELLTAFEPILSSAPPAGMKVTRYDLSLPALIAQVCSTANRNLTRAEWDQYVGGTRAYEQTCPQFPPDRTAGH